MIGVLNIITDTNIGGAGNVLLNFMKKTDRAAFDHTVIVPENAMLLPKLQALGIKTVEMRGIADQSFSIAAVGAFKREIKRINPDIVHTHASMSARIAAKQWGKCAIVCTRHCAYPQSRRNTTFPMKNILGFINNHYSHVFIAISPAARDNLTDTGADPRRIVTMFNGVEPVRRLDDGEKSSVRASLGISDEFVCAVIARLVPEKGHAYIIEAADILKELPIVFVIVGTGPVENELKADAKARGLENCIFTGYVDDVAGIENIANLQLNASYGTETSSLSLLESMSLGIPSVASDYGGNPHLVTDGVNGLIVPKRDGKAMAAAIRKLYGTPQMLASMGKASLEAYNERFSADIMARNIEAVYSKVLGVA